MKKFFILLISILLLTGCGDSQLSTLDISKASIALDTEFSNMASLDEKELLLIYGLDTSLLEDYEIKSSSLSNGNFYALIKVSKDNKKEVQSQVKNMFDTLENQSNLYSPEAVNLIKNRLETSVGDYLIYLVGEDTQELYNIVKEYIS